MRLREADAGCSRPPFLPLHPVAVGIRSLSEERSDETKRHARDPEAVIALWTDCGLTRPWNDPAKDISRKLRVQPELFLVAESDGEVVGSVMGGYDGHRGWANYLAVTPAQQGEGVAQMMMAQLERLLLDLVCPKINVQVRADNDAAQGFYERIGFLPDVSVSLGKRLIPDA